jgi:hypothetical protein
VGQIEGLVFIPGLGARLSDMATTAGLVIGYYVIKPPLNFQRFSLLVLAVTLFTWGLWPSQG